jgi:riboflavin synthase
MNCNYILGIKVDERNENAVAIQKVLTEHGCEIRARLGLPQQDMNSCTDVGLLILQICSDDDSMESLLEELNSIPSVTANYMIV